MNWTIVFGILCGLLASGLLLTAGYSFGKLKTQQIDNPKWNTFQVPNSEEPDVLRGPPGPAGPMGATGPQGPPGESGNFAADLLVGRIKEIEDRVQDLENRDEAYQDRFTRVERKAGLRV